MNGDWGISYEIALRWIPLDLTDDKSTLVQVMAWCHQATSQYLSQCWPRSMSPYGVIRPQWVNAMRPRQYRRGFADSSFKSIFFNENICISVQISMKFVPMRSIDNWSAMNRRTSRAAYKPLSELRQVLFTDACMRHSGKEVIKNCDRKSSAIVSITVLLQLISNLHGQVLRVLTFGGYLSVRYMLRFIN